MHKINYLPAPKPAKFCSNCSASLVRLIPPLDSRMREVCPKCGSVHYQNPLIVVGTIPVFQDQVLLCKRAIQPKYGFWTLPAGFMENNETIAQGAIRETSEEAGAKIKLGNLFSIIDIPEFSQLHIFFTAQVLSPEFNIGPETLSAKFYKLDEIPWDNIAFSSVSMTLQCFLTNPNKVHNLTISQYS